MLDWGWVYGTLVRNTGWTFEQCGDQPAADVFAFLEHLAEYPPDYLILQAVHMDPAARKKPQASTRNGAAPKVDGEALAAMSSVCGPVQPIPQNVRELIQWAESFGPQTVH